MWQRSCSYDWARACSAVARRLVTSDHHSAAAMEPAERACNLDTAQCEILALIYDLGYGTLTKPDRALATTLFKSLCDSGDQSNCVRYARRARAGIGMTPNPDEAERLLAAACAADEGSGCYIQAQEYTSNKRDDAAGFRAAKKGCDLGNFDACYIEGWMIASTVAAPRSSMTRRPHRRRCRFSSAAVRRPSTRARPARRPRSSTRRGSAPTRTRPPRPRSIARPAWMRTTPGRARVARSRRCTSTAKAGSRRIPAAALGLMVRTCVNNDDNACEWSSGEREDRRRDEAGLGRAGAGLRHGRARARVHAARVHALQRRRRGQARGLRHHREDVCPQEPGRVSAPRQGGVLRLGHARGQAQRRSAAQGDLATSRPRTSRPTTRPRASPASSSCASTPGTRRTTS